MARKDYTDQVRLLVEALPIIAQEEIFALKGGTAINLFYRDLPRLSVDIDLTYLPVKDRQESLAEIKETLDRISQAVEKQIRGVTAQRIDGGGGGDTRILLQRGSTTVKVETSPVTRGVVHEPEVKTVTEAVEKEFGFAEMRIVAFEDLFGGKLHAALDRQHPRDLYDVQLLYVNEGLTDDLFKTLLVYVASSNRPPHELFAPNPREDIAQVYEQEFVGMTVAPVTLDSLLETRERLIADLRSRLNDTTRKFLLSLHDGKPDFGLIDRAGVEELPAIRWKLINIEKLKDQNPKKHAAQRAEINALFEQ